MLATHEADIGRISIQSQPGQIIHENYYLEKPFTKIVLVE
jgi:hypothetical protein